MKRLYQGKFRTGEEYIYYFPSKKIMIESMKIFEDYSNEEKRIAWFKNNFGDDICDVAIHEINHPGCYMTFVAYTKIDLK